MEIIETLRKIALDVNGRFKIGCAILDKKNNVLSIAANSYKKTHPKQKYYAKLAGFEDKQYLHAEIKALLALPSRSSPAKILIVRVNKHGKFLPVHPCPICSLALKEFGIYFIESPL